MLANFITLFRVIIAFVSVGLFGRGLASNLMALLLLVLAIALDAVDGWVARRFGYTSDIGAAFDIAADRIVENIYWIYFATEGLVSFWIPAIVIARGCLTDFLRAVAFTQGQTAFGEKTMMQSWWGKLLVGSRASRAAYGIVKCAAFLALGLWRTLSAAPGFPIDQMVLAWLGNALPIVALVLAVAAVVMCVVRGVPVMIEGFRFFRKELVLPKVW
ncbi:MAG: CDP-alcohol phosphatidyltransferase family protein [Blastocatellia bacterium]